ncbi:MAG: alpha/beta fold hydrolase [Agriterribacter sp.]
MKIILLRTLKLLVIFYIIICVLLFLFQEKLIFFPKRLPKDHSFKFNQPFEEINIRTKDNTLLNSILFKADSSRGVIFYLHGNAGCLDTWGDVAQTYTDLHFDVFMIDYRGYGKSEGSINGQAQFFEDVQAAYDELKTKYAEDKIIVLGYSIGTGAAAKTASANNPKLLILQAPYYSLTDMMRHTYPIVPTFILKYKFETSDYLKQCKMPVVIFHGDRDEVIYYGSSLKLQKELKKEDRLITLAKQGHNGITENIYYKSELEKILGR